MGMQAQESECAVCLKDPYGISDKCWDMRLDHDLKLEFETREHPRFSVDGDAEGVDKDIYVHHRGARLQWSVNLDDWKLFNHCRGNIGWRAFMYGVGFRVGEKVDPHKIGDINWEEGIYESPNVRRLFVRLLPCDVKVHLEAHRVSKESGIGISRTIGPQWGSSYKRWMKHGLDIEVKVNSGYGRLQYTKSLNPEEQDWQDMGASRTIYPQSNPVTIEIVDGQFARVTNSVVNMQFFRIKPINKDALKTFFIDLDAGTFGEELPVSQIPTLRTKE